MSSGRHSRALASGNWRSSETDDEPGAWMIQQRGSEHWRCRHHIYLGHSIQ